MELRNLHYVIEDYMYSLSEIINYYENYSSEIPYALRYGYLGNARALQQISLLEGLAYQLYVRKKDSKQVQFKLKVYERDSYKPFDLQRALDLTSIVESVNPLPGHDTLNSCASFSIWLHKCNKEVVSRLFKGRGNTMVVEDVSKIKVSINRYENEKMKRVCSIIKEA